MQPVVEKKDVDVQELSMLERLESLAEKSETAYNDAMRDFRDQFTLDSTHYEFDCE